MAENNLAPLFSAEVPSKHSTQENTRTDQEIWKEGRQGAGLESLQGHHPHPPPPTHATLTQTHWLSVWLQWVVMSLWFVFIYVTGSGASPCASRVKLSVPCCPLRFPPSIFAPVVFFWSLLQEEYTKSHDDAAAGHPGTLPFTWGKFKITQKKKITLMLRQWCN